jgi:tRNA-modifying protein YgfZ
MKVLLRKRALIKISGRDAESFLQAQLSNDISLLKQKMIQLNAYCQHQGKILALFWVMRDHDSFLLSFPRDLLEKIQSRLKMFVIMSDVEIEDISDNSNQIGVINETYKEAYTLDNNLSLIIENSKSKSKSNVESLSDEWIKASIDSLLPEIFLTTSEKFVPQMLNLDINEIGVNFSKGCYPGQEVVARLHYLGSAKRRLFSFQSDHEMQVGDSLYCTTSKTALARGNRYKGSGIVVSKVKYNSLFFCLATLDVDLIGEEITLNNEHGPKLDRTNDE